MTTTTRILIADDHAILRAGLRLLIESHPGLEVVGEAGSGAETIEQAERLTPDLILLDLNMPELDGLAALPRLKKLLPDVCIVILTMPDDVLYLQEALEAGASAYVLKNAVDSELLMAIQAVLRGEVYVHSAMTQKLLTKLTPRKAESAPHESNPWDLLSERELSVLRLVAQGYTNAQVASELFLSVKTVETYRARGMEKLNLQTRAQLVKAALERGLLD